MCIRDRNYRKFISDCKTERECVTSFVEKAEKAGFVNLEKVIAEHTALKAGDRVYANNMGKGMALFEMCIRDSLFINL